MTACTDDERRRVAERLRAESGPSLIVLMSVLGVGGKDVFPRLADLIDPDTTTDTTKSPDVTTKCDREALLALAEEMGLFARTVPYPSAGKRVATFARRIRECCGAVS